VFHICWCRDGQALKLTDIYSNEQLAAAVFTDACGEAVSSPVVVNERPLFIDFPRLTNQELPAHSPVRLDQDDAVVYACLPAMQGVPWQNQQWHGAYTCFTKTPTPSLGDELTPEKIAGMAEFEVLRDRRNRLWNIAHPFNQQQRLTVKRNHPRGIKRLSDRFKASKGRRHWNTASTMLLRGINTPTPIAFYEHHSNSGIRTSYYICEYIREAFSSRQVCAAFRQGQKEFRGFDKDQWFDLLGGFICKMHNSGILHRDLSVGNLLLTQAEDGKVTPYLIDIGRARIMKKELAGIHRIQDLMRICYKLDWPDRELFIQHYSKHWGKSFLPYWRLAVSYYDFKQGSKKYLKAKFRKNHTPKASEE
jgi:tRNA A-37 threonylcarbamoyl transferase component Bud32